MMSGPKQKRKARRTQKKRCDIRKATPALILSLSATHGTEWITHESTPTCTQRGKHYHCQSPRVVPSLPKSSGFTETWPIAECKLLKKFVNVPRLTGRWRVSLVVVVATHGPSNCGCKGPVGKCPKWEVRCGVASSCQNKHSMRTGPMPITSNCLSTLKDT